jgi:hypothetical protein
MKALFALVMFLVSTFVCAGEMPAGNASGAGEVSGVVQEVQNVSNFTYLRLKTVDQEIWAAVINSPVKVGTSVTIDDAVVMKNFVSKGLNKTFPMIVFGTLRGAEEKAAKDSKMSVLGLSSWSMKGLGMSGSSTGGASMSEQRATGNAMGTMTPTIPVQNLETIKNEHVGKATGANARTVEEINKKAVQLKDKTVVVRGKVVKYNAGIMGKNWIHLQDGSGSSKDESDDILVTTTGEAKLGDVVTVKGVVHNDMDFGSGYAYKVLIEDATLQ